MTQFSNQQVQEILDTANESQNSSYKLQKILRDTIEVAREGLEHGATILGAVADRNSKVLELKSDITKTTRILAVFSFLIGLGCLIGSWQLQTGFWPIVLTAIGSALLTFVLINLLLERGISLYTDRFRDAETELQRVIGIAGKAKTDLAGASENLKALPEPQRPRTLDDLA